MRKNFNPFNKHPKKNCARKQFLDICLIYVNYFKNKNKPNGITFCFAA